jgi:hypothetical protein
VHRKRQAQHPGRTYIRGSAAGDAAAEGSSAHDQRQVATFRAQVLGDGTPCGIHVGGRCGCPSSRDPVGLLDQGDCEACAQRHLGGQAQVVCGHAAARAVAEHHQPDGFVGRPGEVHPGVAVWCRDEGDLGIGHAETVRGTTEGRDTLHAWSRELLSWLR